MLKSKKILCALFAGLLTASGALAVQADPTAKPSYSNILIADASAHSGEYVAIRKTPSGTNAYSHASKQSDVLFKIRHGVWVKIIDDYYILGTHWAMVKHSNKYVYIDLGDTTMYK